MTFIVRRPHNATNAELNTIAHLSNIEIPVNSEACIGFIDDLLLFHLSQPDPYVAEAEMSNGLIKGHAYSVTKACLADIETPRVQGKIPMIRVRNPWGNEAEWKGAFSDK